jgi:transcriptional regulator with XRE-family HTH domain
VRKLKPGDKLRDLLEERDLSQKDFAALLGMAPSTLGNYIRNEREADYETLKRFAAFFNVSIDYLLDYHDSKAETQKEDELLRVFRSLTDEQQELYIEQGRVFVVRNHKKRTSSISTSATTNAK